MFRLNSPQFKTTAVACLAFKSGCLFPGHSSGYHSPTIFKFTHTATSSANLFVKPLFGSFKRLFRPSKRTMGYFVIGVSGVTCSGKTSLTKLIQKKFPWAQVIHQDHYFHDDDWPHHIRCPEAENHVQYETFHALDMDKMYKDVQVILDAPPVFRKPKPPTQNGTSGIQLNGDKAEIPNYDDSFVKQISDIDVDVSKYASIPVLIIEGFTIFGSDYLYDKCDARFFCSLEKETCRSRRVLRNYNPPDTPSYFEKVVWPEYEKHFEQFIHKRSGVTVFDGSTLMETIWRDSIQVIMCRMEEKWNLHEENKEKKNSDASL